ncbi:gfo/Idh/MocA family oxidoreductase, partial [bacterium]
MAWRISLSSIMKLINAGIIGLGVGERHVAALHAHPACRVVALCDWNKEKLRSVGLSYPNVRLTESADNLLSADDIDIVSIASWDDYHATQIVQAIRSGKHVFAEKPLCMNIAELQAIREELCAHPNVKLGCNLILRRCPRFVELRRRIRAGEMGRIFSLEADYDYGRMHKIVDGWRGRIDNYSVFLGGGVHMVDLILWLVGKRVTEVVAWGNRIATEGTSFRYEDYVVAMLRFEDGTLGKV